MTKPGRDPRLDFFRGAAMFIIFIAHCRGNFLWDYIPARFGLSDAADMFVFLSGIAASIAFGGTFLRHGALAGTARIVYRCAQLYIAHLGLFFTVAAIIAFASLSIADPDYVEVIGLERFFTAMPTALVELFTLSYVPHYFDILPLYMVVLAMVPIAMLLARINPLLVPVASVSLYVVTVAFQIDFLADASDARGWYFNPLAWQLIFFTGFCLGRGWLKPPPQSTALMTVAIAILVLGVLITTPFFFMAVPLFDEMRLWANNHGDKTYLDLLQYVHFMASAYVAVGLLRGREHVLLSPMLKPFVKCGQQALSVFLSGMVLSHVGGIVLDQYGTGLVMQILVNGVAFGLLLAVAYTMAFFKSPPWTRRADATPSTPSPVAGARPAAARSDAAPLAMASLARPKAAPFGGG